MVKIRLSRTGSKNKPSYRIVASDSRCKRNGKTLAIIGFYDPKPSPPAIKINHQLLEYWINHGAQLTSAVKKLIEPAENEKTSWICCPINC